VNCVVTALCVYLHYVKVESADRLWQVQVIRVGSVEGHRTPLLCTNSLFSSSNALMTQRNAHQDNGTSVSAAVFQWHSSSGPASTHQHLRGNLACCLGNAPSVSNTLRRQTTRALGMVSAPLRKDLELRGCCQKRMAMFEVRSFSIRWARLSGTVAEAVLSDQPWKENSRFRFAQVDVTCKTKINVAVQT